MRWGAHWGEWISGKLTLSTVSVRVLRECNEQLTRRTTNCLCLLRTQSNALHIAFDHLEHQGARSSQNLLQWKIVPCFCTMDFLRDHGWNQKLQRRIYKEVFMYWYVGAKTATNPTTASATLTAVWWSGCNVRLGVGVWLAVCREWSQQPAPSNNFHLSDVKKGTSALMWAIVRHEHCRIPLILLWLLPWAKSMQSLMQVTMYVTITWVRSHSRPLFFWILWIGCNFYCPHLFSRFALLCWFVKLHLIDFTFAFKLVIELVDLRLLIRVVSVN